MNVIRFYTTATSVTESDKRGDEGMFQGRVSPFQGGPILGPFQGKGKGELDPEEGWKWNIEVDGVGEDKISINHCIIVTLYHRSLR